MLLKIFYQPPKWAFINGASPMKNENYLSALKRKTAKFEKHFRELHDSIIYDPELIEARANGRLAMVLEIASDTSSINCHSMSLAQFFGLVSTDVECIDWYGPAVRDAEKTKADAATSAQE